MKDLLVVMFTIRKFGSVAIKTGQVQNRHFLVEMKENSTYSWYKMWVVTSCLKVWYSISELYSSILLKEKISIVTQIAPIVVILFHTRPKSRRTTNAAFSYSSLVQ